MDFLDYREKLGIGFCDTEKFKYFLQKIFNVLSYIEDDYSSGCIDVSEFYSFCNLTGTHLDTNLLPEHYNKERYRYCISILNRHIENMADFLSYYIAFTNSIKIKKYSEKCWTRKDFANLLVNMCKEAHIPLDMLMDEDEYFAFPKGAIELDSALVSQPLEWLKDYPKSHKTYCTALRQYSEGIYIRDVADNLRKTLEDFLREFLNNNSDLNKNKKEAEAYLKEANADPQLINMFGSLITHYYLLNNEIAKHNDKVDKTYLEFLLYQTGIFIRMLIVVKQEYKEASHAD